MRIMSKLYDIYRKNYTDKLRKRGAKIGKNAKIYDPLRTYIDKTRPWLLTIGDYTLITSGVKILTHDYSLSTLRRVYGEWIGEGGITSIGENCFIGMNSIILMGTKIGDNVIVGAGSVVHGNIPDNVVIAGNPAKIICTLQEHYENRKKKTVNEVQKCILEYKDRFNKLPKPNELEGFKFLFCPRTEEKIEEYGFSFNASGDDSESIKKAFFNSKPLWNDYSELLKTINIMEKNDG
jgi:acetyltransferase-like isoleucine patch superfamily enzyme